jgi:hypothetical protein
VELSFSKSCLKSSLLSAEAPVPYGAIASAGSGRGRGEIGRGAHEAEAAAAGDLAAAGRRWTRWR